MKFLTPLLFMVLAGCNMTLPGLLGIVPTPAEFCGLSDADKATLAVTLQSTVAQLNLACTLAG